MHQANERRLYTATPSLIGWAYTQNDPSNTHHTREMRRDHSVYAPSQWEMVLHCNAISHWLGTYTEWSLDEVQSSYSRTPLTHWGGHKMAAILQTTFSNPFHCTNTRPKHFCILIIIFMKFVPKGQIYNQVSLSQIKDLCHTGNKPLSEPMMTCSQMIICVTQPQCIITQVILDNLSFMGSTR